MKIQNGTQQPRKTQPEFLVLTVLLFLVFVFGAGWVLFAPKQTFSEDENLSLIHICGRGESNPRIQLGKLMFCH